MMTEREIRLIEDVLSHEPHCAHWCPQTEEFCDCVRPQVRRILARERALAKEQT